CDVFCSFCVIPYTRGRQRSRTLADCVRETAALTARGHREIVVTGVNIGTYMEGGADFAGLLDQLSEVHGVGRLRISSIEPMTVDDSVIDLMARNDRICPYLHLCLQSGDDAILETMKRPYTAAEYRSLLLDIVARVPNAGIGTDIIVGFPGETEESFAKTYALLEELPFYHFHVFSYSEHTHTRSAKMPEKIQPEIVKKRSEKVRRLGQIKKQRFHEAQVGRTLQVLFERRDPRGRLVGHAENYALVSVDDPRDLTNRIVPVEVREADVDEVRGTVLAGVELDRQDRVTA
ncbi:MAG: MiaB/RimO family radical SAM methylthiotransferase, partial [Gemmatimonadetes bacterium]|nr:MiaB/RimO family radical SAM methylthiotransferase [Gemmatimonadota bacterium]